MYKLNSDGLLEKYRGKVVRKLAHLIFDGDETKFIPENAKRVSLYDYDTTRLKVDFYDMDEDDEEYGESDLDDIAMFIYLDIQE